MVSEIIQEGLLVLSDDLYVDYVSTSFGETFGVERGDLEGEHLYEVMGGRWNVAPVRELLETILPELRIVTGVEVEHEFEHLGHRKLFLKARRLEHYSFILLAVDDQTETAQEGHPRQGQVLEEVEARSLDRMLRDLPDIVMIHDVQAHATLWCNDRIEDVLGFSPEEVYHCGSALLPFLVHPADLESVYAFYTGYEHRRDDGRIREITCRLLHKEGSYRWIATRETVFGRDAAGSVREVLIVARNITRQKEAEHALRELMTTLEQRVERRTAALKESEERFRALVKASAQILWTTEPSGAAVDVSPSWGAFTGQTYDEAKYWGWLNAVHPDDRDDVRAQWLRSVADERSVDAEFRLFHAASGAWRWTHCRAVPLRDEDGTVRGWVGMNTDIDERKRAEAALRTLNSRLREQAREIHALATQLTMAEQQERRRIAHVLHDDLQQQLFGIQMKLRTIRESAAAGDTERLLRKLEEAEAWLGNSLSMTRRLTVDLSPPVLHDEGLVDALRWLAVQVRDLHGLTVEIESEHAFRMEDTDMRVLLFQIVRELLFNVVKHSGVDTATVELQEAEDEIVIHVIDRGRGFDVEEALSQARVGGFGFLSGRERIRLFGGDMEITSMPGRGTRVTLRMPVQLV